MPEVESAALRAFLADRPRWVSSAVARVELSRVVRRVGASPVSARDVLARIALVPVDEAVLDSAASIGPDGLRTLDAIHLASAQRLGQAVSHVVTYDHRLADAAAASGLRVVGPA